MRIALVNEKWTAGATRCARDLERGLAGAHEVRYYPSAEVEGEHAILADLRAFRPNVVHLHSYYGDLDYGFMAQVAREFRVCFTPHDPRPIGTLEVICWTCEQNRTCVRCPMIGRRRSLLKPLHRYARERRLKRKVHARLPDTTAFVCPSRWMLERLRQQETGRFRLTHIPNGVDTTLYRPMRGPAAHLSDGSEGWLKILYVAHGGGEWALNQRKGLLYLAEAFTQHVFPRFANARLMIAGDALVPNHATVVPLGKLAPEELPSIYSEADVVVLPTLADNLPYTVLEAMACGAPVIASRVGGIPEQVEHGVTGLLVEPRDSKGLGHSLLELLGDPERRRKMGAAGRCRVEEVYSIERFVRRHEELYASLA